MEDKKDKLPDIPDDVPLTEYTKYWLSAGAYDVMKWLSCLFVPAFGTFYAALAGPLGLPCEDQVTAVCLAFSAFLGLLLGSSEAMKTTVRI